MNRNDLVNDFIIIMANCDTPEQGKKILEDYVAGKTSVSRRKAAEIVRKKMDEDTAKEIAGGDMMVASVVPEATVDFSCHGVFFVFSVECKRMTSNKCSKA